MTKYENDKNTVTPDANGLMQAVKRAKSKGPAPVHLWNPDFCGDLDMEIKRDGTWFYLGTPMGRIEMVKMFSSILRRDGDDYFLVTPVEKVGIRVEDAPFVATDFDVINQGPDQVITFTTHVGDTTVAGPDAPIRVTFDDADEPSPYVLVRTNLEALIDRKSFYRLMDIAEIDGDWFGIRSSGAFFPIMPAADLE